MKGTTLTYLEIGWEEQNVELYNSTQTLMTTVVVI